jgi:hypothetical protein
MWWQDAGGLSILEASVKRRLSFLDYMAGGCEIQCLIAIDFSGNNPPPDNPSSCHYAGVPPDFTFCPFFYDSLLATDCM